MTGSNPQSAALPYGVAGNSLVFSQYPAIQIYNISWMEHLRSMLFQIVHIGLSLSEEADILRFRTIVHRQSLILCYLAGIGLMCPSQWKNNMCQLILCQMIHHIGLILLQVQCLIHFIEASVRIIDNTGIVSGSKIRAIKKCPGPIIKHTKLHLEIAEYTGIRCNSLLIRIHKITQHNVLVNIPQVNYRMWDSQEIGHFGGIA